MLYANVSRNHSSLFRTALIYRRKCSHENISLEILQNSKLPTYHFQKSLPRLPVPKLPSTLDRYILSQSAILSEDELSKTRRHAQEFLNASGQLLQQQLNEFAQNNTHTSYITQLWFDLYLNDRRPVVLNHQPVIVFQPTKLGLGYDDPIIRATNMITSALRFYKSLQTEKLEPEVYHMNPTKSDTLLFRRFTGLLPQSIASYGAYLFKAFPLDMNQFSNVFSSTRIPCRIRDELRVFKHSRHLVIFSRGHSYIFEVLDGSGHFVPAIQIASNLNFIRNQPRTSSIRPPGIGVLTAMPRDDAASCRSRLIALGNEENLRLIDSALFAICLDEDGPQEPELMLKDFVAGPCDSRWFDKSLTLLINASGQAALTFEHSWGDGVAVLRFFNEVYRDSESRPAIGPDDYPATHLGNLNLPVAQVQRLEWILDDRVTLQMLQPARQCYLDRLHCLDLRFCQLTGSDVLNKQICKMAGLSPDAMMQLSFQLANDLVHSRPAATYESCSTAAFKHGRTETIRSASPNTRRFVELFRTSTNWAEGKSNDELFTALEAVSKSHVTLIKEAAMGQGWDRHLFALHKLAEQAVSRGQASLPSIFNDPNYAKINEIILSTSTLSSPALQAGAFCPTSHDGYGISYAINDENCGIIVTTWRNSSYSSGVLFAEAFAESAQRLAKLLHVTAKLRK